MGTFVTFKETERGWLPVIKNQRVKNTFKLCNWDFKDPIVQYVFDSFKSDVRAEYKEYSFQRLKLIK